MVQMTYAYFTKKILSLQRPICQDLHKMFSKLQMCQQVAWAEFAGTFFFYKPYHYDCSNNAMVCTETLYYLQKWGQYVFP